MANKHDIVIIGLLKLYIVIGSISAPGRAFACRYKYHARSRQSVLDKAIMSNSKFPRRDKWTRGIGSMEGGVRGRIAAEATRQTDR